MNWTSVNASFSYTDNVTVWDSSDGAWMHDSSTNLSTFTPALPLNHSTEYWVTVNVTATDMVGNALDQDGNGTGGYWPEDVLIWGFTTAPPPDTISPYALGWGPNGTAVNVAAPIHIEWNETMNWTSVEDAFSFTDGQAVFGSQNGTWAHDPVSNTSTFTPQHLLEYETFYTARVNCTATDQSGNPLDQDGNGTGGVWPDDVLSWNFTTDDAFPAVLSTIPGNGDVDVDPEAPITVVFSEPMNVSSAETGFTISNATATLTALNGSVAWNSNHTRFTFIPFLPLARNTSYYCNLDASVVRDPGGKALDGNGDGVGGDDFAWGFVTWVEPPLGLVLATFPPNGATNIAVNTYINVGFNVMMTTTSVESAFSYSDGTNVWSSNTGNANWFSDDTIFSFQPGQNLAHDTTYTVTLRANSLTVHGQTLDGNGNGIAEGSPVDDYVFSFTTSLEPPYVISAYPENGQTEVPTDLATIYINFSKEMDVSSVVSALSISPSVSYTRAWTSAGFNLSIGLNEALTEGVVYTVGISALARALDGIHIDGNADGVAGDPFALVFTTEGVPETDVPQITYIFPMNNVTVPVNAYVEVGFNEPMNRTAVEAAFTLSNATGNINGTFIWTTSSNRFRFMPSEPLAYNTTYFVEITTTATDEAGNRLERTISWRFFTESEGGGGFLDDIWWLVVIIVALLMLSIILYLRTRALSLRLRRARIEIKKLKSGVGESPKSSKSSGPVGALPREEAHKAASEPEEPDVAVNGEGSAK